MRLIMNNGVKPMRQTHKNPFMHRFYKKAKLNLTWPLHVMMIPPIIMLVIFCYVPMVGIIIAFQDFMPTKGFFGSPWIGLERFEYLFLIPDIKDVIRNTLTISVEKIITAISCGLLFALLLNEIKNKLLNRFFQATMLFPWFISWVILGNIFLDVFSTNGAANDIITTIFGVESIPFLRNNTWFRIMLIGTNMWKDMGYNMVIFSAVISGIDPNLYEAAIIDGANKFKQCIHVTLPSLKPTIILLLTLALGGVLSAGFDQILVMYNSNVMDTADIIDTYIYRLGLLDAQYSLATAVGLFKSVVGLICIGASYYLAKRFANYRIF